MADTLCGPSNALQSFKTHSQVDRTLQQDRLAGPRFSPAQGFRSPDPRTGSLDADFHAFENAVPNPFQFQDPFLNESHYAPLPFQHVQQPQASGWAADFTNLRISDQPVPAHQFRSEAPLVLSSPGGWQNEFMRNREMNMSSVSQGKQVAFDQQQMPNMSINNYTAYQMPGQMSSYAPFSSTVQQGEQTNQFQHQVDQSTTEDWSRAFEDAFHDAISTEQVSSTKDEQILHSDGTYTNDHSQEIEPIVQGPENIRIGSDAIEYTEMKDRTADQDTRDSGALARVAGELLQNVQHDSSEKFQNSQFLDLMRRIRDKHVEVRNNDFENTGLEPIRQAESTSYHHSLQQNLQQNHQTAPAQHEEPQDSFRFPDMNAVYEPDASDVADYSFESDQFPSLPGGPRTQIQDLHPGGRLYPGSPEVHHAHMSGGLASIPADEFEKVDESKVFATRYQKPSVENGPQQIA